MKFNVVVLFHGEQDNCLIKNVLHVENHDDYFVVEREKDTYYFRWYDDKVKAVFMTDKEFP